MRDNSDKRIPDAMLRQRADELPEVWVWQADVSLGNYDLQLNRIVPKTQNEEFVRARDHARLLSAELVRSRVRAEQEYARLIKAMCEAEGGAA